MRENFLTPDLSISGNFKQFWFCWQKSHPPLRWGKIFWHQIYPFQAISSNFGFDGRKAIPPMKENFWHQIYPFQAISSNFCFGGRKAPPPPPKMRENFLTPDLSISGNFKQLWFWWQKAPLQWGKFFWHQIYPFQAISSNFGFGGRKPPSNEGSFFDTRSIHFRQFQATLVLVAEKPSPPKIKDNFLTPDLSISGNFKQLWFWWQKSPPPPPMKENFWHQIYPFQAISSNFGFGGRNPPPPQDEGNIFDTRSIHFRQFQATLVLLAEKPPPDEGKFFDTRSIHFRQFQATFVLVAEKPPPPRWGKNFWHQIYPFQAISSNFGFGGRKGPLLPNEGKFLTPDLSISGNFKQLWFWWQKSPPPLWGKFFLTPDLSISGNFK